MMFRSRSLQHARGLGLRRFREPAQMHEQLVDVNGVRRKGRNYGEVICGGWAIRKMRPDPITDCRSDRPFDPQ